MIFHRYQQYYNGLHLIQVIDPFIVKHNLGEALI